MSTPQSTSGTSTPASVGTLTDAKNLLAVPGQRPVQDSHRLKNVPGYSTPIFKGKEEQRAKVQANIASKVRFTLSFCFKGVRRVGTRSKDYLSEGGDRAFRTCEYCLMSSFDHITGILEPAC